MVIPTSTNPPSPSPPFSSPLFSTILSLVTHTLYYIFYLPCMLVRAHHRRRRQHQRQNDGLVVPAGRGREVQWPSPSYDAGGVGDDVHVDVERGGVRRSRSREPLYRDVEEGDTMDDDSDSGIERDIREHERQPERKEGRKQWQSFFKGARKTGTSSFTFASAPGARTELPVRAPTRSVPESESRGSVRALPCEAGDVRKDTRCVEMAGTVPGAAVSGTTTRPMVFSPTWAQVPRAGEREGGLGEGEDLLCSGVPGEVAGVLLSPQRREVAREGLGEGDTGAPPPPPPKEPEAIETPSGVEPQRGAITTRPPRPPQPKTQEDVADDYDAEMERIRREIIAKVRRNPPGPPRYPQPDPEYLARRRKEYGMDPELALYFAGTRICQWPPPRVRPSRGGYSRQEPWPREKVPGFSFVVHSSAVAAVPLERDRGRAEAELAVPEAMEVVPEAVPRTAEVKVEEEEGGDHGFFVPQALTIRRKQVRHETRAPSDSAPTPLPPASPVPDAPSAGVTGYYDDNEVNHDVDPSFKRIPWDKLRPDRAGARAGAEAMDTDIDMMEGEYAASMLGSGSEGVDEELWLNRYIDRVEDVQAESNRLLDDQLKDIPEMEGFGSASLSGSTLGPTCEQGTTGIDISTPPTGSSSNATSTPSPTTNPTQQQPRTVYKCPSCHKTFPRRCELTKHSKCHTKPHICTLDLPSTSSSPSLRPCNRSFSLQKDLIRHQNSVHQLGKKIPCPVPGCKVGGIARADNLGRHISSVHPGWKEGRGGGRGEGSEGGTPDSWGGGSGSGSAGRGWSEESR